MPPNIIADSDDEDEGYSPVRPGAVTPRSLGQAITGPAEGGSHTPSTDLSFFQNVYDEQNGVAQENFHEDLLKSANRETLTSSEVTAPAPFQRIVTGFIDPSSLTSVSDPTNTGDPKVLTGHGNGDWTQVSTPGRRKAPTAVMDDPWDVPNSPEVKQIRIAPKIKIKLKRKEAQPTSKGAAKQTSVARQEDTFPSWEVQANHHALMYSVTSPTGKAKRRRIEASPTQASSDEVNLVSIPFSNEPGDTQTSMLPPTLPMENQPPFWISTKPLTDAQRMEYQSVELPSSGSHQQDFLPPIYQQDMQIMDYSGTSTNVNTPRSDGIGFSTAPLPSIPTNIPEETVAQPPPQPPGSSPDIISVLEAPTKSKSTKQRGRPRHGKSRSPIADEGPGEDVRVEEAGPQLIDLRTNDKDSDYVDQKAKPKKSRGRPRKKDTGEATQTSTEPLTANPGDGKPPMKQKKKRGRPKKQDTAAAMEESPHVTTSLSNDIKAVASERVQSMIEPEIPKGEHDASYEENTKEETIDELSPTTNSGRGSESSVLKEMSQNSVDPKAVNEAEEDDKPKGGNISTAGKEDKQHKPSPAMAKSTGQAKGLSSIISKPMYRVGLSKRSRIAPLLKSLRK